ncbi:AI-2E family transporter [Streptococcus sp. DD12]|uniref:AI-2E family transporter n=1 Tax=Streptococcus sp. DD12 TaxID=1777880 RepID=UPI00079ACD9D|nr:AI-2E family transporter [Streptococcus sp. DD12]KXT76563.1 hypothetical protein STRDD12_00443 [Streptococcus sp. DD12]
MSSQLWEKFLANQRLRRLVVLVALLLAIYALRSFVSLFLLIFVFAYAVYRLEQMIHKRFKIPSKIIVLATYAVILGLMYLGITRYLPVLINESISLIDKLLAYINHPPKDLEIVWSYLKRYISQDNMETQLKNGASILLASLTTATNIGKTFLLAFFLSFLFSFSRQHLVTFSKQFLKGPNAWLFKDIQHYGKIFTDSFGVVLETQIVVAFCNTILTTLCLYLMGIHQLMALALMIFILSLIPVAGVIISAVPLAFVAYSVGGMNYIFYVIIMLAIVHAFETYIINPKLYSDKTELPTFYVFLILLLGEHYLGVWGLIIGIPIFLFAMETLGVSYQKQTKSVAKGEN